MKTLCKLRRIKNIFFSKNAIFDQTYKNTLSKPEDLNQINL